MRRIVRNKHAQEAIMLTNLTLLLPITVALVVENWVYLFIAAGLLIFSPLYHQYDMHHRSSKLYTPFRLLDWTFAGTGFLYLFFFTSVLYQGSLAWLFYSLLVSLLVFFFYGWIWGDYERLHPWFHFLGALFGAIILFVGS